MIRGIVALVALVLLVSACSSDPSDDSDRARSITTVAPSDRVAGPDIAGTDLEGEGIDVAEWRGKVVVVNIWGSWCPPCRVETADLNRVAREYDADVRFLGIAVRENATASRAFARKFEVPYPSISDPSSALLTRFADPLPAVAIPTTYVLDRDGRVAARLLDRVSYATLSALVDDVQKEVVRP